MKEEEEAPEETREWPEDFQSRRCPVEMTGGREGERREVDATRKIPEVERDRGGVN